MPNHCLRPRATLHNSTRAGGNTLDEESDVDDFEFAENSAQYWVSRNVGDGIVLPGDTRDTVDKCLYLSMLNYVRNRDEWVARRRTNIYNLAF
jgi:hypothetical protein